MYVAAIWSLSTDHMEDSLHALDFRNAEIPNHIMKKSVWHVRNAAGDCLKKTKKGSSYYGCENNPECDFMSWQKPSAKKCPKCGSYMVEKGNKIVCSETTCGYVEQI